MKGVTIAIFSMRAGAMEEGEVFSQTYLEDVQFVLSRTNHHHHKVNKKGVRIPTINFLAQLCQISVCVLFLRGRRHKPTLSLNKTNADLRLAVLCSILYFVV